MYRSDFRTSDLSFRWAARPHRVRKNLGGPSLPLISNLHFHFPIFSRLSPYLSRAERGIPHLLNHFQIFLDRDGTYMVISVLILSHHPRLAANCRPSASFTSFTSSISFASYTFRTPSCPERSRGVRNGPTATPLHSNASALFSRLLSTTPPATSFSSSSYKLFAVTTGVASNGTPPGGSI
jgi:hypothetical protein